MEGQCGRHVRGGGSHRGLLQYLIFSDVASSAEKRRLHPRYGVFKTVAKVGERRGKKARIVYASSSGCVACQNSRADGPGGDDSPLCEDVGAPARQTTRPLASPVWHGVFRWWSLSWFKAARWGLSQRPPTQSVGTSTASMASSHTTRPRSRSRRCGHGARLHCRFAPPFSCLAPDSRKDL